MPLEGQHIGRYRLVRLLGSGGMGDVYLAEDARIEQHVAIKVIRAETSPYATGKTNEEAARLFRREARAITKLDHPNILPLFDFGEEQVGDTIMMYLVMPYRQEGSLASWLRRRADGVLLSLQEVASIVQQAAAALQHAHNREVIHQDVKPSNFLLRSREDAYSLPDLLLADFGIAHFMTATSSASQAIRGTPSYMAPAGVFRAGLSKEIDTVLLCSLAKQPEQRFASITAFASDFWQAAQGIPSIQEISPAYNIERAEKAVLPTGMAGVETAVPTLPEGSDSETYIKPVKTPASLTPLFFQYFV